MTWFKVDDSLAFHAKVVQAGNAAMGLWVRAGSWSAQQLTDGHVPNHIVSALGNKKQAERLVSVGLWVSLPDGYVFHQWNEDGRQPTRAAVEKDRGEARERMRKAREEKKARSAELRENFAGSSGGVRSTRPGPSRPDPSVSTEMSFKGGSHVSRGSETSTPPRFPDHCAEHANDPTPGKCGDCADARKARAAMPRLSLVVSDRPEWCGSCNEFTRLTEPDDGPSRRCTACHPLALEAS